jgi:hypothetical protein
MNRVGLFFVDSLFFHRAWSGKYWGFLDAHGTLGLIEPADPWAALLFVIRFFFLYFGFHYFRLFVDFFFNLFHRNLRFSGPSQSWYADCFGAAEFLIPVS